MALVSQTTYHYYEAYPTIPQFDISIPLGASTLVIECWGGGSAGTTYINGGKGGVGGAYAKKTISLSAGQLFNLYIAGGGSILGKGSFVRLKTPSTILCAANGGAGTPGEIPWLNVGPIGDVNYNGGNGGNGLGGGGGASAGGINVGIIGNNGPLGSGGTGTNGGYNGGTGADGSHDPSPQGVSITGGGGGGGYSALHDCLSAGSTAGIIILSWYGKISPRSTSGGATYNYPLTY